MLELTEGLLSVPGLGQVDLLEREVLDDAVGALEFLVGVGQDTRLEEELLEFDKHTSLLKVMRFNTAIVDGLKLFKVSILEDLLDLRVDQLVELL